MRRRWRIPLVLGVVAAALPAAAATITMGPHDVPTVFFISKSDNRDRVDYGMRLDANCVPVNGEAVFPYWRELENAPPVRTHPISAPEELAYGVAEQRLVQRLATGAAYTLKLKAVPRVVTVTTTRGSDGKCTAVARTIIAGHQAVLLSAYVKLDGRFSVEYVDLHGTNPDGAPVEERLRR